MSAWNRHDLPIGEVIFIVRTSQDMTHEDLAEKTGIHRNTILRLEKGDRPPSLSVLTKISVGLGIELWRLVRRAEHLKPAQ